MSYATVERDLTRHQMSLDDIVALPDDICAIAHSLGVTEKIHQKDFIFQFLRDAPSVGDLAGQQYFKDGRSSAERLRSLLQSDTDTDPGKPFDLLEFASGYGCVTRHLGKVMPQARITACDIHDDAVQFISRQIGQHAIGSRPHPAEFALGRQFDVVFALSFFSHMPERSWGMWLEALFRHVKPGGNLIFTTHGEISRQTAFGGSVTLSPEGFWFHASSEQHDLDTAEYGTTITSPAFVSREVFRRLRSPIAVLAQGLWWGHQDAYVVYKPL